MLNKSSIIVSLFLCSTPGFSGAYGLFPAGNQNKAASIESSVIADGYSAVLYNPANLQADVFTPEAEFGMVKVEYSYEHPDFDPVLLSMQGPIFSAGFVTPLSSSTFFGFSIFPTAKGELNVEGVPSRVAGKMRTVNALSKRNTFHLGAGIGHQFAFGLNVGFSAIYTHDEVQLDASLRSDSSLLATINAKNSFQRFVLGTSYGLGPIKAALSYTSAVTKKYKGSQQTALDDSAKDAELSGYDPAIISAGINGHWKMYQAGLTVNREQWAKGSNKTFSGLNAGVNESELRDITAYGVQVGVNPLESTTFVAGYSVKPSPWGDGQAPSDDGETAQIEGAKFGNISAIDTKSYSVGANYSNSDEYRLGASVMNTRGAREVDDFGDNTGYYQVDLWTITGSVNYNL